MLKLIAWIFVGILIISIIFSGYSFYKVTSAQAEVFAPTVYTQQWQKAMQWVRENTPEDAVFGHWWDYGYWVQTIGERATVLDGGNAISYWNHLMGRYALTSTDNYDALEFLYTHETTHFLIDSTDIGKYAAFAKIGSDENYDRLASIPDLMRDDSATTETKNSKLYAYNAGFYISNDIIYEKDGEKVFLPGGKTALGGIIIEKDSADKIISSPKAAFFYQGKQYNLPLRYAYDNGEFIDFKTGLEEGIFTMPVFNEQTNSLDYDGAMLYLDERTVKTQFARLFLYKEDNPYFKLVHSEDDFLIAQIRAQTPDFNEDFIVYQGVRGPIRIWEISYPQNIKVNPEYLETGYPEEIN